MNNKAPTKVDIDLRYRTMLILWLAQMMSVVMFFVMTQLVDSSAEKPANSRLSFIYTGVGASLAILSFVIRSKILSQSVEKQDILLVQTAQVIGCALCEVPALLGILERFTLPGRDYLLLLGISFFSMALHFPRRRNLLAASYKDPTFGASL
jgi:hypothetical protein